MSKLSIYLVCVSIGVLMLSGRSTSELEKYKFVNDYLVALGDPQRDHYVDSPTSEDIKRGEELVKNGKTVGLNGKPSKLISKYFKCTSCHNLVKEVDDLRNENVPDSRLSYAMENKIPFLQASTFYGIVNKATWYNDDYVKKYGAWVEPARNSLKESIQLCSRECSQGRTLEDWEMTSILSYLWTLQLTMDDLKLSETDTELLNGEAADKDKIALIKSKFSQKNGATFGHLPEDKKKGFGLPGDQLKGKYIYENSCQHCHRVGGESDLVLDNGRSTFKWLRNNITSKGQVSLYHIVKKGTYAEAGHREYMPLYSEEKMSNQQLEDLRAYIESEAKNK